MKTVITKTFFLEDLTKLCIGELKASRIERGDVKQLMKPFDLTVRFHTNVCDQLCVEVNHPNHRHIDAKYCGISSDGYYGIEILNQQTVYNADFDIHGPVSHCKIWMLPNNSKELSLLKNFEIATQNRNFNSLLVLVADKHRVFKNETNSVN